MFISFEGVDGVGKTTQVDLFVRWLREARRDVIACRDPGSTELGEAVRRLLLDHHATPMHRRSEMLLYMAARAQLVEQVIRPALQQGQLVVSDRFLLANVVYQGVAGELGEQDVWQVGQIATGRVQPDLIILLDMAAEAAAQRFDRQLDRMESQGIDFLRRVRQGYLDVAARRPDGIVVVDADRPADAVQQDVRQAARQVLP